MISLSTDHLPPQDRFDYWRQACGKELFGITIDLEPERRAAFEAHCSAIFIGAATLAEMTGSSYVARRTTADMAGGSTDNLTICLQVRGGGWVEHGDGSFRLIGEGAYLVGHSNHAFKAAPQRFVDFCTRSLQIPLAAFPDLADPARQLVGAPIAAPLQMQNLFAATLEAVSTESEFRHDADDAVRHVAQLALLLRGAAPIGTGRSRAAIRFGQYHAARKLIAANLHRSDLSPQMVADWLKISLRQLHLLFEPTGVSCARTILSMRLQEARRRVAAHRGEPVARIASDCGFPSLTTFYRTFQAAYGVAPRDMRSGQAAE